MSNTCQIYLTKFPGNGRYIISGISDRVDLRTFARKFSNIDFFLRILPLKVDELVMSEM